MKKVFSLREIPREAPAILLSASALFLNVTVVMFAPGRRFFLQDTGRKRAHFDRELNGGRTLSLAKTRSD